MRIGVIAPNMALRAGIRTLLSGTDSVSQFEVIYEAASTEDYAQEAPQVDVLVIAADVVNEANLQRWLPGEDVRLAVLLLSDDKLQAQALLNLPLHGWGVLPLDTSSEELQAALQAVHEGLVVGTQRLFAQALSQPQLVGGREVDPTAESLTEREGQVLQLLAHGLANKQIALALSISEHTVKFHVSSIYNKLGATNRTEAVRAGVQRGLVVL
jgi:DNA-binding NarL/FixJ family response regulator